MCTHTWSLIAFLAWRHHWPSSLLPLCFPSPRLHVPPVLTSSRLCWGTKNVQASVLRRNKDREEEGWKRYMKWAWLTGSVRVNRAAAASNSTFLHTGLGSTLISEIYIIFKPQIMHHIAWWHFNSCALWPSVVFRSVFVVTRLSWYFLYILLRQPQDPLLSRQQLLPLVR